MFTGVCLSTGGMLSQYALQVVSQHALQQVSRLTPKGKVGGGCGPGPQPRGKLRGTWFRPTAKGEVEGIWSRPTPKGEVEGDLLGGCLVQGVVGPGSWWLVWGGAWSRGVPGLGGAWSRGVPGPAGVPGPRGVPGGDPPDGYCCGRYASYWNAFLFYI